MVNCVVYCLMVDGSLREQWEQLYFVISAAFIFLWCSRGTCKIWPLLTHTRPVAVQIVGVQVVLESLHKWVQAREITWSLHFAKERKKSHKPPLQVSLWLFNYFDRCLSSLNVYYGLRRYVVPTSAVPRFVIHKLESEAFTITQGLCSIISFVASATKPRQQQEILSNRRKMVWLLSRSMNNAPIANSG